MNHYELMVIFPPTLTEDEQKEQSLQIQELLKREKAELHLIDRWGKRKLAYPVKKHRQGYYDWFYFEMDPGHVAEIDRKLKMSETVLRFLCLRMEKVQIQNLRNEVARRTQAIAAAEQQPPEPVETPTAQPVETQNTEQETVPEAAAEPDQGA